MNETARGAESWAAETARIIIDGRSLYTRTQGDPFFYSSGWASPVFIDCKKLISIPEARDLLVEMAIERLAADFDLAALDAVAGCELTGVPFATLIADRLAKPLVLVCRQSKGFGRLAQVEGDFDPGARMVLVDDLATDGVSETVFLKALQRAEAEVVDTFVLVDFGVYPTGRSLMSLAQLPDVIARARTDNYLGAPELAEIDRFIADPSRWSRLHGGIGELRD